jgi:hypothetical protein
VNEPMYWKLCGDKRTVDSLDDLQSLQQLGQLFLIGRVIRLPREALWWGERFVFVGLGV